MRIRHCSPHPRKSARVLEDDVCVGGDANWNSLAGFSILRPSHPHSVLLGILVNVMFKLTLKVGVSSSSSLLGVLSIICSPTRVWCFICLISVPILTSESRSSESTSIVEFNSILHRSSASCLKMSGEVTRGDIDELRKSLSDLTTVVDGLSRLIRKFVATSENGESNQLRCSLESSSLASSFKENVFDPDHSSTLRKRLNFDQSPDKKNRCRGRQLKRLEPNSFKWSRKGTRHTRGKRLKQRFGKDYAFYRMDIPVFNGQMNIDQILDWLSETERFFKCMKVPEFRRVKMVVNKLKGTALEWWNQMDMLRRREHKCPIRSWVKMKAIIRQRFLPADFKKILLSQYKNCKQGTRTVDDYTMEFHQLSARFEICESNDQFIARYVRGLKKEIQENIHLHTLLTLTDAIDVATYIESEHQIF